MTRTRWEEWAFYSHQGPALLGDLAAVALKFSCLAVFAEFSLALTGGEGAWDLVATSCLTLQQTAQIHDRFFAAVERFWRTTPTCVVAFMIGDWNCRIGRRVPDDASVPDAVLGPHDLGRRSGSGHRLLQLAAAWELKALYSFFQHDEVCWSFVQDVKVVSNAEFPTDHSLVVMHLRAATASSDEDAFPVSMLRPFRLMQPRLLQEEWEVPVRMWQDLGPTGGVALVPKDALP